MAAQSVQKKCKLLIRIWQILFADSAALILPFFLIFGFLLKEESAVQRREGEKYKEGSALCAEMSFSED